MDQDVSVAIHKAANTPMRWGVDDCVMWASHVSKLLTGRDFLSDEHWEDEEAGRKRIAEDENLGKALLRKFSAQGLVKVHYDDAPVGSFALIAYERDLYLAVRVSPLFFACRREYGVDFVKHSEIRSCWAWVAA